MEDRTERHVSQEAQAILEFAKRVPSGTQIRETAERLLEDLIERECRYKLKKALARLPRAEALLAGEAHG